MSVRSTKAEAARRRRVRQRARWEERRLEQVLRRALARIARELRDRFGGPGGAR